MDLFRVFSRTGSPATTPAVRRPSVWSVGRNAKRPRGWPAGAIPTVDFLLCDREMVVKNHDRAAGRPSSGGLPWATFFGRRLWLSRTSGPGEPSVGFLRARRLRVRASDEENSCRRDGHVGSAELGGLRRQISESSAPDRHQGIRPTRPRGGPGPRPSCAGAWPVHALIDRHDSQGHFDAAADAIHDMVTTRVPDGTDKQLERTPCGDSSST